MRRLVSTVLATAAVVVLHATAASADRVCAYPTGSQSPQVRALTAHGLACRSAQKVISAVRNADDWRGAYFGDTWGYVSYPTGGYDASGYLRERRFRCDYRLRGLSGKYVLASCHATASRRVTVTAQLHGR